MLRAIFVFGLIVLSNAAPKSRSKGPQLVYDQKQKGDYNIQVHLKNFQVIALLGDESTGGFGDYDYNYDYGDFTNKPSGSSTSSKPPLNSSTTPKPVVESESSTKDSEKSTVAPEVTTDGNPKPSSSVEPLDNLGQTTTNNEKLPLENVSDKTKPSTIKDEIVASSTPKDDKTNSETVAADSIPGQIQVQVLQSPEEYANFGTKKVSESSVIDSSARANEKRCSSGFTKDKKGRCRRLRRPQSVIPFDFGRLAHLASRFRSSASDGTSGIKLTASSPDRK